MFFSKVRKRRREMENYLRRISDMTNPNSAKVDDNRRGESRFSRIFPVLIAPWENDAAALAQCTFGLTRDMSEHGMSVVITRPFRKTEVVVGIWPTNELLTASSSKPGFILGTVRQEVEIGAAFYQLGVQLNELLGEEHPQFEKLFAQSKCLLPPHQLKLLRPGFSSAAR